MSINRHLNPLLPYVGQHCPEMVKLIGTVGDDKVNMHVTMACLQAFGTNDPEIVARDVQDLTKSNAFEVALKEQAAILSKETKSTSGVSGFWSSVEWGSPTISIVVISGFLFLAGIVALKYGVETATGQLIVGALITKFSTVCDYWLGSSHSSVQKSVTIAETMKQLSPPNSTPVPAGASLQASPQP